MGKPSQRSIPAPPQVTCSDATVICINIQLHNYHTAILYWRQVIIDHNHAERSTDEPWRQYRDAKVARRTLQRLADHLGYMHQLTPPPPAVDDQEWTAKL